MEKLLEDISFSASDNVGKTITINAKYVNSTLENILVNEDLSHYIL